MTTFIIGLVSFGVSSAIGIAVLAIAIYVAPEGKYGGHF